MVQMEKGKKENRRKFSVSVCARAYRLIVHSSTPLWLFKRTVGCEDGWGGVWCPPNPSSSFLLLPPDLKKVPGPWRRDTPLPWLHCGRCTRCCLIVTRWTLTAQPALTMCLLDTAACGTSTPLRVPPGPWAPPSGRWGPRLDDEVIFTGTMSRQSGGTKGREAGGRMKAKPSD